MENGTKYDVVNLKTGEKLEDYRILVADGEQAGWLCPMDITKVTYGKDYIALADGTKSTATYDRMTNSGRQRRLSTWTARLFVPSTPPARPCGA